MKTPVNQIKASFIAAVLLLAAFKSISGPTDVLEYMRGNLYVMQAGSPTILDGNLTHYSDENSNLVDYNDA